MRGDAGLLNGRAEVDVQGAGLRDEPAEAIIGLTHTRPIRETVSRVISPVTRGY